MKIGLIDIDSKIPNLALMKLSTYYKNKGYKVELTSPLFAKQYDEIYASQIFDFTSMPILPENAFIGGSGISLKIKLADEIESCRPDYFLYKKNDFALGYTSRGCNRKCPWCVIPQKEGKFRIIGDIYDFWAVGIKRNGYRYWDEQWLDHIMLLDNAINTDEQHFLKICSQIESHTLWVDFSQGLDIRLFSEIQARALDRIRLKLWKQIHFAWDLIQIEKFVRTGISILEKYNLKRHSMFYVLIGFNSTPEEDIYRVETLRGLGVDPFVMPFDKFDKYQRRFARWVNHKAIFKSVKWENYGIA